jgi:hypothetical protein
MLIARAATVAGGAHRFTHRKSVSLLTESPIRLASCSPGRPPSA